MDEKTEIARHFQLRDIPGALYSDDELGAVHDSGPQDLLQALTLVKKGEIYDLDSGRWPGMPVFPAHPPFIMTSYRTPQGLRTQKDFDEWRGKNTVNMGLNTEIIIDTVHTGIHLEALIHTTCVSGSASFSSYVCR